MRQKPLPNHQTVSSTFPLSPFHFFFDVYFRHVLSLLRYGSFSDTFEPVTLMPWNISVTSVSLRRFFTQLVLIWMLYQVSTVS